MCLQWRTELKCARLSVEIPQPNQRPMITPIVGYSQLVARYMERGAFPAIGRFDLDKSIAAIWLET